MTMELLLNLLMGIGFSAANGFRIFIPFLIIGIASLSGNLILADSFNWIGTKPELITFSIATILEIAGYYIPWVDNILDTIASPAAVIAGVILLSSVVLGMSPVLKWTLAIIAGGGIAATIQAFTGVLRATSTTTTLIMLGLIINSQFRILIVREIKHIRSSLPGKGLHVSSASAIIGIAL